MDIARYKTESKNKRALELLESVGLVAQNGGNEDHCAFRIRVRAILLHGVRGAKKFHQKS